MIMLTMFVVIINPIYIPDYSTFTSVISDERIETEDFCNVVRHTTVKPRQRLMLKAKFPIDVPSILGTQDTD